MLKNQFALFRILYLMKKKSFICEIYNKVSENIYIIKLHYVAIILNFSFTRKFSSLNSFLTFYFSIIFDFAHWYFILLLAYYEQVLIFIIA